MTIDRWEAYEAEWRDTPFVDDIVGYALGYRRAEETVEVPMTKAEYFKRYGH
jgi:hypothetical protein